MQGIQNWLEAQGLGRYAEVFVANDISVDILVELSEADLRELGVSSLGDRKRLLKAISTGQKAQESDGQVAAAQSSAPMATTATLATASAVAIVQAPAPQEGRPAPIAEDGERRHATVMFSDLTGYTALNETLDPEEVEQIMTRIKSEAVAVIERHGGRVNQFVGDEVMAMFGIPVARRDDPRRAVSAALDLHQVVDAIAEKLSERLGRVLSMHSGIQTGLVIARRSDSRSGDFTLTGDTVNTAARLRSLAEPGQVVVSPQTWQQVSDFFEGKAGQPIELKGKERPMVPWRILCERSVPKGGSRPLVGRSEEMQQFHALVQSCLQRKRGRVIFVRGDPGMGKSRLVAEFLDVAREQGLRCHSTAILDFGARTGHDAMRRLAQSLLGLAPDADEASRAEALGDASKGQSSAQTPFLYDLLDVTPPPGARALLSAIDANARQKSTLEAFSQLAAAETGEQPQLLLIEDIHWADAWALKLLSALAALTSKQPMLLMMSTRFAGDPSIGEWRTALHGLPVTSIDLGPLAAEDALRLAAGAASISEALLHSCVERAEGNPLFLEQLLLNAGDESSGHLPGSIQSLIQARMDRLSASDKAALQAASIWGQRMSLQAIRHLLQDPNYDSRLLEEQFLLRPDGDELVFNHALIRDGAYGSLLHAKRRQWHQLAAEWIEPDDVALAAEHYERAEDKRAPEAYRRAGQELAAQYKFTEALALVERGLDLAQDPSGNYSLRLSRARLLLEIGRAPEAIEAGQQALDAAQEGGEKALALLVVASGMRIVDRVSEGLEILSQAQPLAEAAGMTLELSHLHHLRGNLLFGHSQNRDCRAAHEKALELALQAGSVEAEAAALGGIGDATYAQGLVRTGYDMITRCMKLANEHGLLRVEVAYGTMIGWCRMYLMDFRGAVEASSKAVELAQRISHRRGEMMGRSNLAMVDGWILGNVDEATRHLDLAQEIARTLSSPRLEGITLLFRCLLSMRSGDKETVRQHLAKAFDLIGPAGLGFLGPQLLGLQARAAEDAAKRQEYLERGMALLKSSKLTHNFLFFYEAAIQATLDAGEWDASETFCQMLGAHFVEEPLPWCDFVVARGRALCRHGRGERSAELRGQLESLRHRANDTGCQVYLPSLDSALAECDLSPL